MRKMLIMLMAAGVLAACGSSAQGPTAATGATVQPAVASQTSPADTGAPATAQPTAAPAPTGAPAPAPSSEPQQPSGQPNPAGGLSVAPPPGLVDAAQRQLAAYLKLTPDQLALQSANKREWPDGALGCPQQGRAYPQVITEGFLLVFTNPAQTQSYELHTAMGPAQLVLCENGQPVDLSPLENPASVAPDPGTSVPAAAQPAVDAAKAALAQQAGLDATQIAVTAFEEVEWNDSSLGCPKPGQVYMQVITPGYRVVLEAQGQRYEYHTDLNGRVVSC
jgi:hypothetical protein